MSPEHLNSEIIHDLYRVDGEDTDSRAAALGWFPDNSPATEMRKGNWFRHVSTYELKSEEEIRELIS